MQLFEILAEVPERKIARKKGAYIRYDSSKAIWGDGSNFKYSDRSILLKKQDGKCAICGEVPRTSLNLDHDHKTGIVRGMLCSRCNTGLGKFGDNIEGLLLAIKYLEKTPLLP